DRCGPAGGTAFPPERGAACRSRMATRVISEATGARRRLTGPPEPASTSRCVAGVQAAGTGRPVAGTAGAGIAPRDPDTDGRTGPVGRRFARTPSGVGCDGVTWVVTSRYRPS